MASDEQAPRNVAEAQEEPEPEPDPVAAAAAAAAGARILRHAEMLARVNDAPAVDRAWNLFERARGLWGTAHIRALEDFVAIGPIGSRFDTVLFWRAGRRVATGCFEGTLDELSRKVEEDYAERIRFGERHDDQAHVRASVRHRAEYRALIQFLMELAPSVRS